MRAPERTRRAPRKASAPSSRAPLTGRTPAQNPRLKLLETSVDPLPKRVTAPGRFTPRKSVSRHVRARREGEDPCCSSPKTETACIRRRLAPPQLPQPHRCCRSLFRRLTKRTMSKSWYAASSAHSEEPPGRSCLSTTTLPTARPRVFARSHERIRAYAASSELAGAAFP